MFDDHEKCKGLGCRDCDFSGLDMGLVNCRKCDTKPAWQPYSDYSEIWCDQCGAYAKAKTDKQTKERWNKAQLHESN